jgi:1,4-alpha-glucan branching enzyme
VGAALTSAGTAEVPATLGWVRGEWLAQGVPSPDGAATGSRHAEGELAVAHEFLAGGLDAWRLAVDAARSGTDFTAEARALGAATATVHRRLAEALGQSKEAEPGKVIAPGVAQRVRQAWAEAASAVGPYDAALDNLLDGLDGVPAGPLQRIHGDLHLGQILQVPGQAGEPPRWAILDFEGEPLRPIAERNFPDVPLRDVVGMLRSFDYAAGAAHARAGRRTGARLLG